MADIIRGIAIEGGALVLRAQLRDHEGALFTPSGIASAALEVWQTSAPPPSAGLSVGGGWLTVSPPVKVGSTLSLAPADVILASPKPWKLDGVGFNFEKILPGSALGTTLPANFPKGVWLRIEAEFVPVGGLAVRLPYWVGMRSTMFGKTVP